jgi:uncharacterized protein YcgI (DUF1989 family)
LLLAQNQQQAVAPVNVLETGFNPMVQTLTVLSSLQVAKSWSVGLKDTALTRCTAQHSTAQHGQRLRNHQCNINATASFKPAKA